MESKANSKQGTITPEVRPPKRIWHVPRPGAKVSVILLDWGVRESFHSLDYLARQRLPRSEYEIIWVEYRDRKAAGIEERLAAARRDGAEAPVDQWIVMGVHESIYYHKHVMYNVGIAASQGRIVVICDSDAIFTPNFLTSIVDRFEADPEIVLHLDEVRNADPKFYPFAYPPIEEVLGPGAINWSDGLTSGLRDEVDPLHSLNYGACMCAWRDDLIAIGGADEHEDYLGHVCGPYELTFRLTNYGRREVWSRDEFIYHVWHPGQAGDDNLVGPHDGAHVSTRALEARDSGRSRPCVENGAIEILRTRGPRDFARVADRLLPPTYGRDWTREAVSTHGRHRLWKKLTLIGEHRQYNLIECAGDYFAAPQRLGAVDLNDAAQRDRTEILKASNRESLILRVDERENSPVPERVWGRRGDFRMVEHERRFYALPARAEAAPSGDWRSRADLLSADTLSELETRLEESLGPLTPDCVETVGKHNLVKFRGRVFGIPQRMGPVDLFDMEERARPGVLWGDSVEEVRARALERESARPIEFAGWLPAFRHFGNCGRHPQFDHANEPPPGYVFQRTGPEKISEPFWSRVGLRRRARLALSRLKLLRVAWRLAVDCRADGASWRAIRRFLRTRSAPSQWALPDSHDLVFLTSVPYTLGQYRWVIEIEDAISLFFPFVQNGQTSDTKIEDALCFRPLRTLLEAPSCRAIVTHMRSTAENLPKMFRSQRIAAKTFHVPLGVPLPERAVSQKAPGRLELLFSNSWHQDWRSFSIRGGFDALEAYAQLHDRYPHVRLTLRTKLPENLPDRYRRIIDDCGVRVLDRFLPREEWERLRASSHVFLLPSDRIHIVSILQAMALGMVVVVSDGWGMEEYVTHDRNGLIVKGRYGKVTWVDEQDGMLRENYSLMQDSDPVVTRGLVEALSRLIEDESLRKRLGETARRDVETQFNLRNWNLGLKRVFDHCHRAA